MNWFEHLLKTKNVIRHSTKREKKCARIHLRYTPSLNSLPNFNEVYSKASHRRCISLLTLPQQSSTRCWAAQTTDAYRLTALEARNRVVSRVGSFWGLWGRLSSVPLSSLWWLAGDSLELLGLEKHRRISIHTVFSLWVSVSKFSLFVRIQVSLESETHPTPVWPHLS